MLAMPVDSHSNGAQTLLVDADDTLWENNIYFERAIASFISFLNHHEYTPGQVREVLNQVERESIVTHGYGLHSFAHSLIQTFERLAGCHYIPLGYFQLRTATRRYLDDWQQPEVGHQSGAGRGVERCVRSAWEYMGAGARRRRCGGTAAAVAGGGEVLGVADAFLISGARS
jgi:hypothetical protein